MSQSVRSNAQEGSERKDLEATWQPSSAHVPTKRDAPCRYSSIVLAAGTRQSINQSQSKGMTLPRQGPCQRAIQIQTLHTPATRHGWDQSPAY